MASTAKALNAFFNGFGLPAYSNNSVPEEVSVRHITYSLSDPEWDQKTSLYCEVWDRSTSNAYVLSIADQIVSEIGTGIIVSCDGGYMRIHLENPIIQIRVDGDWRSAYINMSLNAFHMPGA